jgi:hypothetical protein
MDIFSIIILSLLALIIFWLGYLSYRVFSFIKEKKEFMQKLEDQGLDDMLMNQAKKIKKLDIDRSELYKICEGLAKRIDGSLTKCGVIRFNPFAGEGGNQSFVVAILNDHDDGVVISSLYSRNTGSRIYAKPIKSKKSSIELTKEEREALDIAK